MSTPVNFDREKLRSVDVSATTILEARESMPSVTDGKDELSLSEPLSTDEQCSLALSLKLLVNSPSEDLSASKLTPVGMLFPFVVLAAFRGSVETESSPMRAVSLISVFETTDAVES